jgi:[ribosomal protein S5]-alanine N-acetyltransferase
MILFESERLYVQPYTKDDADIFFALNGDAEIMQYIREPKTREQSDAFLEENLKFYNGQPGLGRFAVFTKDENNYVGSFSLLSIDNSENIHLGYALLKPFHGKGLATELVMASFDYVFRTIANDSVHALTVAENIGSQKVLLKCGFTFITTMNHEGDEVMVYELPRNKAQETRIK